MFKVLIRLYLITIFTFAAAIYVVPEIIVSLFHERFVSYNVDMSRGMQALLVKQFKERPVEQWSALAQELDQQFKPIRLNVLPITAPKFDAESRNSWRMAKGLYGSGSGAGEPWWCRR